MQMMRSVRMRVGPLDEGELNGLLSIALSIQPLSPFQVAASEEPSKIS